MQRYLTMMSPDDPLSTYSVIFTIYLYIIIITKVEYYGNSLNAKQVFNKSEVVFNDL